MVLITTVYGCLWEAMFQAPNIRGYPGYPRPETLNLEHLRGKGLQPGHCCPAVTRDSPAAMATSGLQWSPGEEEMPEEPDAGAAPQPLRCSFTEIKMGSRWDQDGYPLVNVYKAIENHQDKWEN